MHNKNPIIPTLPLPDLDLCLVEGGEFMMGDDKSQYTNEKPRHRVRVSGFWLGRFPVTQQLWQAVMGNNPSGLKGEGRPVENVSWLDAQEFLQQLNDRPEVQAFISQLDPPGTKFRLPTEAEWEYAARGGRYSRGTRRSGSRQRQQVDWYGDKSGDRSHSVKLLHDNELGLHDMNGNVWEWCQDWFSEKYYAECLQQGTADNPQGPDNGSGRVLRGGGPLGSSLNCPSAYRYRNRPYHRIAFIGLRLALPFQ